ATLGWDASAITTARMCAEVYAQIKNEDWSLVGNGIRNFWPHRLWDFKKPYQWNGGSGGAGIGYNLPASLGAALANKRHGRLTVALGGDGDFMFVPGTLWTAAHHRIPMLYIVNNNRAYHQELMYLQAMANRRRRGHYLERRRIRLRCAGTDRRSRRRCCQRQARLSRHRLLYLSRPCRAGWRLQWRCAQPRQDSDAVRGVQISIAPAGQRHAG